MPDDERWKLFKNVSINIIDEIIEDCKKRFENKCNLETISKLKTDEWLKSVHFHWAWTMMQIYLN